MQVIKKWVSLHPQVRNNGGWKVKNGERKEKKIVEIKSLKAYKNKVAKQNLEEKRFFWVLEKTSIVKIKELQWRVWSWLRMNASGRPNTCKPRGILELASRETGVRVRNAYATYLRHWDSPGKLGLIPDEIRGGIALY